MDNVAILIVSCDAYCDTWQYFFKAFDLFWPDCTIKKYLITNTLIPNYNNTKIIATGPESSWSAKMIKALGTIEEDNILLMLDDYFICQKVDNETIAHVLNEFTNNGYDYLRIMPIPKVNDGSEKTYRLDGKNLYEINLQAALWRKEYFLKVLRKDGLSAWQIEALQKVSSPERINGNCYATNYPVVNYLNGVIQGKWFPITVKKMEKLGIPINTSQRGTMSRKDILRRDFKNYVMHHVSVSSAVRLKKILKKLGIKFVTEN